MPSATVVSFPLPPMRSVLFFPLWPLPECLTKGRGFTLHSLLMISKSVSPAWSSFLRIGPCFLTGSWTPPRNASPVQQVQRAERVSPSRKPTVSISATRVTSSSVAQPRNLGVMFDRVKFRSLYLCRGQMVAYNLHFQLNI